MSHWDDVREQAQRRHAEAAAALAGVHAAAALLAAAGRLTGVPLKPLRAGHKLLDGAEAVFDATYGANGVIWINRDIPAPMAAFYAAHEYAHVWLHREHTRCSGSDLDLTAGDSSLSGAQRVEGYSLHERREREANTFAQEFLLPAERLRCWYHTCGLGACGIAAQVGVPLPLVYHQLARALLLPTRADAQPALSRLEQDAPRLGAPASCRPNVAGETPALPSPLAGETPALPSPLAGETPALPELDDAFDESQAEAAQIAHGPFLLEAGPGTGKTRTLVARIVHLLDHGVAPGAILALTFSNRAAEEMRARVAAVAPEAAARMWMGTFHSFGLELLRKYGERLGLDAPRLLEPLDAVAVLEAGLLEIDLHHYQNLYDPTMYLHDILAAISRAKDELVAPVRYAALAEAMLAVAANPDDQERAERALEVARAYTYYQDYLEREGLLDFGDLIARAVALLRSDALAAGEVRRAYSHILVDEYQDVNRASALLLREIAGTGRGLWVVGDVRQAIYRFRGAAPLNMRLFATDFSGATVRTLRYNYRSRQAIVNTFAGLAPRMAATAGQEFRPWEVRRAGAGMVRLELAADAKAEGELLAREIQRQHAAGVAYRDQAVLCRTHTVLARVAAGLQASGVPVLYLGNLFERPEIRDLLALLSLICEGHGHGLVRVARFPEYAIPLDDVRTIRALARAHQVPFPRALTLGLAAPELSERGRAGLARLAGHLDGGWYGRGAWGVLAEYLFGRSSYLRDLLAGDDVAAQQRRLAVFRFLQYAQDRRPAAVAPGADPKRAFLDGVRRLALFGEEHALGQVAEAAGGIDAVCLLTIHASKGLEFPVVYLPALAQGLFPLQARGEDCPPPRGMLEDAAVNGGDEEEECLFFVALSRARDTLVLSRAARYGKVTRRPSRLLTLLPVPASAPPQQFPAAAVQSALAAPPASLPPSLRPRFEAATLDAYMDCPRRYYYENELELGGRNAASAYVQFHRCVYAVVRWLQEERAAGRDVDEAAALAHLACVWEEKGPGDHAYAALYQESATKMVARAVQGAAARGWRPAAQPEWEVALPHGRVAVKPDHVEVVEEEGSQRVLVQRLRTGRLSKTGGDDPIYGLYQRAVEQVYPGASHQVQIASLSTGETEDVALSARSVETRLKKYDAAIKGILQGEFAACPDARTCPRCPFYFICPSGEES